MNNPYLTIVVSTRNDNHGGDLLQRTQTFLSGLLIQCNKYKINTELIIVEWNPPKDKPLLKEVLVFKKNDYLNLRYIVFPRELHSKFKYQDTIPLYQMIAKNIGIRRAKGEFVLCTNIDILFSNELFQVLSKRELEKNTFYRSNRCDIPKEVMDIENFENQLKYAKKNILVRHGKDPQHVNITTHLPSWTYYFDSIAKTADFLSNSIKKVIWNKNVQELNRLDFMACGDFTLMSKEDWLKIQGYVELDLYSLHVDSMALISAKSAGLEQVVFKRNECTYHIFHNDGWTGFSKPTDMIKFLVKRPSIDWYSVGSVGEYLIQNKCNWDINSDDWGYVNEVFDEYFY